MGASHSCGPAPFEPPPGSVLAARYFRSSRTGLLMFHRSWAPTTAAPPRAAVFLVHGYGEHVGRYEALAAALAKEGFIVHGLDQMGHGGSEGDRAYITSVDDAVGDILQLVTAVHPHPGLPLVLFGHSMGGLFALRTLQTAPAGTFAACVLSGPALSVDPSVDTAFNRFLARSLSGLLPKLPVQPLDPSKLSCDPHIVENYKRDPLNYHGSMRVGTGYQVMTAIADALGAAPAMGGATPLLVVHGAADELCLPAGSRALMAAAGGVGDKTLIEYPGLRHEILNERDGAERVTGDILAWLDKRLPPRAQ